MLQYSVSSSVLLPALSISRTPSRYVVCGSAPFGASASSTIGPSDGAGSGVWVTLGLGFAGCGAASSPPSRLPATITLGTMIAAAAATTRPPATCRRRRILPAVFFTSPRPIGWSGTEAPRS